MPSSCGIIQSRMPIDGASGPVRTRSASSPAAASTTSWPARTSTPRTIRRKITSSSATNTRIVHGSSDALDERVHRERLLEQRGAVVRDAERAERLGSVAGEIEDSQARMANDE